MVSAQATRVTFKNILFATDFSTASERALRFALSFAKRFDSKLFVAHVAAPEGRIPVPMEPVAPDTDLIRAAAERELQQLESLEPLQLYPHETILRQGDTWAELSKIIQDKNVDLVVVGTQGRGIVGTLLLGSVAESIIRHAGCPVLSIGPEVVSSLLDHEQMKQVLFATDFSDSSCRALNYALSFAEENDAALTLLHVVDEPGALPPEYSKQIVAEDEANLWALLPPNTTLWCKPEVLVESGIAADEIVRVASAKQADVIIMGIHRGGAIANHLPWTVAHSVLRRARCPVLTVL